jgi:Cu(I)/Ag(I) efflux system membrane fusion protein
MFVQMQFMDTRAEKALLIPTEAVIQTGKRTVVMLAEEDGRFRPVDVEIGIESGGQTEIKRGLQAGQRVVVSSQFLIDSEASLKGVEARLNVEPQTGGRQHGPGTGQAKIEAIGRDTVTLVARPHPVAEVGPDDHGLQAAEAPAFNAAGGRATGGLRVLHGCRGSCRS